jgi:hypothetical protein
VIVKFPRGLPEFVVAVVNAAADVGDGLQMWRVVVNITEKAV